MTALEEHGFSAEVAGDLDAARQAVLARIPEGSSVITNTSVTLDQTGQHSQVGKILEIQTELPGRIHIVLIRQPVGY